MIENFEQADWLKIPSEASLLEEGDLEEVLKSEGLEDTVLFRRLRDNRFERRILRIGRKRPQSSKS